MGAIGIVSHKPGSYFSPGSLTKTPLLECVRAARGPRARARGRLFAMLRGSRSLVLTAHICICNVCAHPMPAKEGGGAVLQFHMPRVLAAGPARELPMPVGGRARHINGNSLWFPYGAATQL